jgi:Mor family transcriptional regulator
VSYKKAADVLPQELVDKIQDYIDGEYIYIPRKEATRKCWGETTNSRSELSVRNLEIYNKYSSGMSVRLLSEIYYLSPKSLQKIIARMKTSYL